MKDNKKQVDAFVALPKEKRKSEYFNQPKDVQRGARKVIESRRGIAYRGEGGVMVLTKKEYIAKIVKLERKIEDLPVRLKNAKAKKVELEEQLADNYGEEALNELNEALK